LADSKKIKAPGSSDNLSFTRWSLRVFGKFAERHSLWFVEIKNELARTDVGLSVEEFVSLAMMCAIFSPIATVPAIAFICVLLQAGVALTLMICLISAIVTVALTLIGFYVYPGLIAEGLKKNIDNNLPFATIYLSTLAGTGMPVEKMFRVLADFKEYGEISKQVASIVTDTEVLGVDIATALAKATKRTPSQELKDLFWGIRSTILSGGDLKTFLIEKSAGYMENYRRQLDVYVDQLGIFTELYITAIVVGSILFIVMSTIMGLLGSAQASIELLQGAVVYFVLPVISIVFMVMISLMSPG